MSGSDPREPELTLIIPCYNEAESIPYTLPGLCAAFAKAGRRLEIVAVDNGSSPSSPPRACPCARCASR